MYYDVTDIFYNHNQVFNIYQARTVLKLVNKATEYK